MKKRETTNGFNFVNDLLGIDQINEQIMDAYNSSVIEQAEHENTMEKTNETTE